jgi:hypothetical protein
MTETMKLTPDQLELLVRLYEWKGPESYQVTEEETSHLPVLCDLGLTWWRRMNNTAGLNASGGLLIAHGIQAFEDGYEKGHRDGYDDGYLNGHRDGRYEGYLKGHRDGRYEGYEKGLHKGRNEGYEDAYNEGRSDRR